MDPQESPKKKSKNENNLLAPTSAVFRASSQVENEKQQTLFTCNFESAKTYSTANKVSMNVAMSKIVPDFDKWQHVRLQGHDSNVGDIIKADKIIICCNSKVINGLYNDTILVQLKSSNNLFININDVREIVEPGMNHNNYINKDTVVTYDKPKSYNMTHSGDKFNTYGLQHIIEFNKDKFTTGYIISSPWKSSSADKISTLTATNPILEIRTEDENMDENLDENVIIDAAAAAAEPDNIVKDPILKRFILPQDYTEGGDNTACINAEIKYDVAEKKWIVKIRRDFINGFANDTKTLVSDIYKLNNQ